MSGNALQIEKMLSENPTVMDFRPVGSRVTCNPPPTDTDEDWLVYVSDLDQMSGDLSMLGFHQDGDPELYVGIDEQHFRSFRRGDVNLVLTSKDTFFDRFMVATSLAKRFNLLEKADRIALFRGVLYGAPALDERARYRSATPRIEEFAPA